MSVIQEVQDNKTDNIEYKSYIKEVLSKYE